METLGEVLLVEDDPDINDILALVLGDAGLHVVTARALAPARALLATDAARFDAVVSDKNLPDGNGLSLLTDLRAAGGDAEVVLITGFPSVDSVIQALRLGVYDYLEKPFRRLEDVAATVLRACDHRKVRRERDEANRRALAAERRATLVHVAAGLAHEVKNPLQGINFACANARDAITHAKVDDAVRVDILEQVDLIHTESARLKDLVEGVLDLGRPEPRPKRVLQASKMLNDIVYLHGRRAQKGDVALVVVASDDLAVEADEADLSRALDNLVRNAIDVAPAKSTVTLEARVGADGMHEIAVRDEGPGFPKDARAKAFTPFFTTKARGFGLGLCQVAAAAERAGGTVTIEDNVPAGTRIALRLPRTAKGAAW